MEEFIQSKFNYWIYVLLMMIGLWGMIAKNNMIKKLIGMSIFQTAIILFYVSIAVKSEESNIPILPHHGKEYSPKYADKLNKKYAKEHGVDGHSQVSVKADDQEGKIDIKEAVSIKSAKYPKTPKPDNFANPLPHVLMLTAIVVGVATLGLALSISQKIYRHYGTLEEDELLKKVRAEEDHW
jgi:multicomponent Na+:H+ antiporter subunit C